MDLSGCTSLSTIEGYAFQACGLTTMDLSGCTNLSSIGQCTFTSCDDLTSMTLPNSLTGIGDEAFYGCSNLDELVLLSKNPPTLGEDALLAVSQDFRIIVPEENAEAYKTAEGWKDVAGSVHGLTYQLEVTPPNGSLEIFRGGTSTGSNPTSVTFTVTNKSAVPLSGLKVSLDNAENFTLDIALMDASLAPGESTTFTVSPKAELAQGSYQTNITVTSDIPDVVAQYIPDQVAPAEATMVCTVKTVGLTAAPASLDFGSVYTGYTQPEAKTVTVTNTGEQAITLTQPASQYYDVITAGSLELHVGGKATFTVQPKTGLTAGEYSETLTVSGTYGVSVDVALCFVVEQQSGGGSSGGSSSGGGGGGSGSAMYAVSLAAPEHGTVTVSP
ncbi:leucine-rich repeat protein [Flavonifractor sp. An306]|uniref:leucine-rich repeat protein n=1 Tax=Flavonifractor sp. An306 TaxID=1965629 RepID=UPI0013A62555|nr:leucine-rich repeat protein [Flavonifractor sp. An306]